MNRRAEQFNLQGMLIGILVVGLFFSLIGSFIAMVGEGYDTDGYISSDISKYNAMDNLSADVNEAYQQVDKVTVDKTVFDFFSDIYNKVLGPFKFIYRSFAIMLGLSNSVVSDLHLLSVWGEFFSALLIILVIIGIVMIKFYMNKQK